MVRQDCGAHVQSQHLPVSLAVGSEIQGHNPWLRENLPEGVRETAQWPRVLAALTKEPETLSGGSQSSLSPAPGDRTPLASEGT